jgi:hypothetical protein
MLKKLLAATAVSLALAAPSVQAATITYNFTNVFENADGANLSPSTSPYAVLKLTDVTGGVELLFKSSLEASTQFIGGLWLNLVNDTLPTNGTGSEPLVVNPADVSLAAGAFALPGVKAQANAFSADGAGLFDLEVDFAQAAADRFNGTTDEVRIFFAGLGSGSFSAFSQCNQNGGPGNCPKGAAIHIQGIGERGSSVWASGEGGRPPAEIPIPAAAWLLGAGLLSMGAIGRRRLKGQA